jgi:DNA-binding NarL/FixJ family response regulator
MFKIVWIDDDIPVLEDVISPLDDDRDHYKVHRIVGVPEARKQLELVLSADLLLLDIIGPSGSETRRRYPGLDLLQDLRQKHHFHGAVICFSVVDRDDVTLELKNCRVSDIVHKPVRPSELKRKIDSVLSAPRTKTPA